MGNDGGSIPRRSELVKLQKKAVKMNPELDQVSRYFFCALSKKPLIAPIGICKLGKLYNKEAIINYLLDKEAYGDADKICPHIKKMSQVKTLNIESTTKEKPYTCPISLKALNGKYSFVYLPCSCVFYEGAITELNKKLSELACPTCSKPYKKENIKPILPKIDSDFVQKEISLKRKAEDMKADTLELSNSPNININTSTPTISAIKPVIKTKVMSKAVQSIFISDSDTKKSKPNYLCQGTFNRYA